MNYFDPVAILPHGNDGNSMDQSEKSQDRTRTIMFVPFPRPTF